MTGLPVNDDTQYAVTSSPPPSAPPSYDYVNVSLTNDNTAALYHKQAPPPYIDVESISRIEASKSIDVAKSAQVSDSTATAAKKHKDESLSGSDVTRNVNTCLHMPGFWRKL